MERYFSLGFCIARGAKPCPLACAILMMLCLPIFASSEAAGTDLSRSGAKLMQARLESCLASSVGGIGSPGWHGTGLVALQPWRDMAEMTVAFADTTEPEKQRVKKEEKKKKGSATSTTTEESSTASCFGSCLGGFFASALSSDDEPEVVPAGYTEEPGGLGVPFDAIINPRDPAGDGVTVWDKPGGRDNDAEIVGSLSEGAEATVTERAGWSATNWLRIVTRETPPTVGWVREGDIITTRVVPGETALPDAPPMDDEPYYDVTQQRFEILVDLGVPVFTEGQINDEYSKSLFSVGAATRVFMVNAFQINLGGTYTHSAGVPQFNYIVGTTEEIPSDSRLDLWNFGLGVGQLYRIFTDDVFLVWEARPSFFHVKEKAHITITENKVVTGARTDERAEWRGGFHSRLEIGGLVGVIPIAGYFTYSIFPWSSNNEKSLTFDFLEKSRVVMFGFGITVGASIF